MERYANEPVTTLNGAINSGTTSIVVQSASGFPTVGEFAIRVDDEIMLVTAVSGTTWTVVRGAESTSAASHSNGVEVRHVLTAGGLDRLRVGYRRKNFFDNGLCLVWQKGASGGTAPTTYSTFDSFIMDRWYVLPAGASVTVSRGAGPNTALFGPSNYGMQITGATSVTTVTVGQRLGSDHVRSIVSNQQVYVVSFWVYNSSGANFTPSLYVNTPNAADNFAGGVTNRINQTLQQCTNAAWTRVWHAFNPSSLTNITNGMEVQLVIPSGPLNSGAKAVIVSCMDFSEGSYPGPMELRTFAEDLDIATLYAQKSYQYGTAPASNQTPGLFQTMCDATNTNQIPGPRWKTMRATPAYRIYSKDGTYQRVSDAGYNTTAAPTGVGLSDISPSGARIAMGSGSYSANTFYNYHYALSAEF